MRVESWLRQPEIVKEALAARKCIQNKCMNLDKGKPKDMAFCGCFWQEYQRNSKERS